MMPIKKLNSLGQKLNKITKKVSDVNAVNELINGNSEPVKRKVKNKLKNKLFGGILK